MPLDGNGNVDWALIRLMTLRANLAISVSIVASVWIGRDQKGAMLWSTGGLAISADKSVETITETCCRHIMSLNLWVKKEKKRKCYFCDPSNNILKQPQGMKIGLRSSSWSWQSIAPAMDSTATLPPLVCVTHWDEYLSSTQTVPLVQLYISLNSIEALTPSSHQLAIRVSVRPGLLCQSPS